MISLKFGVVFHNQSDAKFKSIASGHQRFFPAAYRNLVMYTSSFHRLLVIDGLKFSARQSIERDLSF